MRYDTAGKGGAPTSWSGTLAGDASRFRAEGSGYCVFNDIAVAILWLRSQGLVRSARPSSISTCTRAMDRADLPGRSDVFTISVHCRTNFPFRKQQSKIDVELEEATQDEEYFRVVDELLPKVAEFEPKFCIISQAWTGSRATH